MSDDQPMSKMDFIQQKFDNFKQFIKTHAKDTEQVKAYDNMGVYKLILLAKTFFIPFKDSLDEMAEQIISRTQMDEEHKPKIKQYLECFVDIIQSL